MRVRTGVVVSTRAGGWVAPHVEAHDDGEPPWARPALVLVLVGVLVLVVTGLWWP